MSAIADLIEALVPYLKASHYPDRQDRVCECRVCAALPAAQAELARAGEGADDARELQAAIDEAEPRLQAEHAAVEAARPFVNLCRQGFDGRDLLIYRAGQHADEPEIGDLLRAAALALDACHPNFQRPTPSPAPSVEGWEKERTDLLEEVQGLRYSAEKRKKFIAEGFGQKLAAMNARDLRQRKHLGEQQAKILELKEELHKLRSEHGQCAPTTPRPA